MISFVTLLVVLIISAILEKVFMKIHPAIWFVGGAAALLYGFLGIGMISLVESIISFVVLGIIVILIYPKIAKYMGGGVIKGIWMCALFLGRYIVLVVLLTVIMLFLSGRIMKAVKKNVIPGEDLIFTMPIVTISVVVVFLVIKAMMLI